MTLGGLLALGYAVVVSYKRASKSVNNGNVSLSLETIDSLGETFMVLRGTNRKVRTLYFYQSDYSNFYYICQLFFLQHRVCPVSIANMKGFTYFLPI